MKVVVADDSLLFREGLVRLLGEQDFEVVGQMENADDLVRRVGGLNPDLAVVDIRMPPTNTDEGLKAAQELGEKHPEVGVVVLSQYLEATYAMRLLEDGTAGRGYLLKDRVGDLDAFAASLRRVGEGGSVVDPEVVSSLVGRRRDSGPLDELTEREREILELMAEGRSNHGISERLVLSPRTIESHVRTIFQKLDLTTADDDHRRVLAVLEYLRASGD
jgi:DNA-binding NarL/FixJ family response regulator